MTIKTFVKVQPEWTLIYLDSATPPTPQDLRAIEYPEVDLTKGVIFALGNLTWVDILGEGVQMDRFISSLLSLRYADALWLAIYDPYSEGAIAIKPSPTIYVGDVIPMKLPCIACDRTLRAGAKHPFCNEEHKQMRPSRWY